MKKYYLHNGVESSGPFDLTELQIKQITTATPVWFSGMPDWKTAGEIEELKTILKVTPPPFKSIESKPDFIQSNSKSKIMGMSKISFYFLCVLVVLIIGSFALSVFEANRKAELAEKNHKTERENRQFLLQEKAIKEQKERLLEQEKLEEERAFLEKKDTITKRLAEIQIERSQNQSLLEEAKNKLNKTNEFQVFRSAEEKSRELSAIQVEIVHLKNELQLLDNERNQLSLELENLQLKH